VASDDGNIVAGVSNYVVIDKDKCVDDDECVVEVKEADELELIVKRVSFIDAAFKIYKDHAFHKGFSIRCDKLQRREGSKEVRSREFCCSKQGVKSCPGKKIRHLQNGAGCAIVKLGLYFTLNLMGNGFVRSIKWFLIMNCFRKMRSIS